MRRNDQFLAKTNRYLHNFYVINEKSTIFLHWSHIYLYLQKLNDYYYLCYISILLSHAINSILDTSHAKNQPSHKFATFNLTAKQ